MEEIIKELEAYKEHELRKIGLTPPTSFNGNQELHDLKHELKAKDYENAANILRSYINKSNQQKDSGGIPDVSDSVCPDCGSTNLFDLETKMECEDCGFVWKTGR